MDWTCSSTKKMERLLKKIEKKSPQLYQELHQAQTIICESPLETGRPLKGDLKEFMVYDFYFKGIAIRICYAVNIKERHVTFVYCGTRENFYKDVKNYLFG